MKFVSIVSAALILAVLVWWAVGRGGDAEGPERAADEPVAVPVEETDGRTFDPPPAIAPSAPTLWRTLSERSPNLDPPPYENGWLEAGRVLVDVSGAVRIANAWRVGDRVSMLLPQLGASYEGGIERIYEGLDHSRSARGWATGADGRERRFVVTVGPTRVFAYIDTAEGPYELVADARLGWLLPSSSMLAGIDAGEHRHIVPEARSRSIDAERQAL
ncbi:MAG: hypothetical protein OXH09_00370 [Gammaproteobacteria bacterium]|nr:hypothetical protein [Gammaproteobacteria bacterium]